MKYLPTTFRWGIAGVPLIAIIIAGFSPTVGAADSNVEVVNQGGSVTSEQSSLLNLFSRSPFHLELSTGGGYDTNIATASQQHQESAFSDGQAILSSTFGTPRWNATLDSVAELVYFTDRGSGPNPEVNSHADFNGWYSMSRRLLFTARVYVAYQAEPDFSANVGPAQRVGYFFDTSDEISASFHWFGALSTVTTNILRVIQYDNSTVGFDQDRIEETIGESLRWGFGRAALVGEYRFQLVDYDQAPRDSTNHYLLAGVDYRINDRLNVTTRGGTTFRFFEDGTERTAPHGEASLNYAIGRTSALSWNVSYGLEEPDEPNFLSRTTFRTGLQLKYWLSAHVLATVAGYYTNSENDFIPSATMTGTSNEESWSTSCRLEYSLNSRWGVHVGFDYSGTNSDIVAQNYSRERYSAGLNINF